MPSLFNILRSHTNKPLKERKSDGIFRTKEKDDGKNKSATTADDKAAAQRTIEAVITYSLSEEDEDGAADDSSPVSCDSITFPNLRDLKGESIVYKVGDHDNAFFRETTNTNDNTIVEVEGVTATANGNGNGRQVMDIDTELLLNTTVEYGTELLNTTMEELYPASNDDTATELVNTTVEYGTELLNTTIEYATSNEGGRTTTTTEGEETTKNEVNTLISFLPSLCSDLLLLDEVELARSDVVSLTKDDATNNDEDAVITTEESALISSDGLVVETTTTTPTTVATTVVATDNNDVVTTEESTLIADGLRDPTATTTTTVATVDASSDSKDSSNQLQLKNEHMVQTAYAHQEIIHQLKQADEDTKRLIAHKDQEIRQLTQAGEDMKMQLAHHDQEIRQFEQAGEDAKILIADKDQEIHQLKQQADEDNNKIKKYGTLLSSKGQELATIKKILEEMDSNDSHQINHVMQVAHKHKEMIGQFKQADENMKIKHVQLLAAKDELLAAKEEEITKIKKVLTKVMSGLS